MADERQKQIRREATLRLIELEENKANQDLQHDLERVQRGSLSAEELRELRDKHSPLVAAINDSRELLTKGASHLKRAGKDYGPVVKKGITGLATGLAKGVNWTYGNLVARPVAWTYNNWFYAPVSRLYGTLERTMIDSPVTQSVVEASGNVARAVIISGAVLGSAMLFAEAYRPGTAERVLDQTSRLARKAVGQIQRFYQPSQILIVPQIVPEYNEPQIAPSKPGQRLD